MLHVSQVLPKWTKRVITDMTGRDPLGLSRVSNIITEFLLTGIITQTERARYYSFYCWALWHVNQEDTIKKYQDFVDGFRRREAAFALSTLSNNSESSVVGVTATRKKLNKGQNEGRFDIDFRVLPSNELGGYDQYYTGSMYQLGLTHTPEGGIDQVTDGIAKDLALCFQTSIEKTPFIKNRVFIKPICELRYLKKSQKYFSLDSIMEDFADKERLKLVELFFGLHEDRQDERTILRRHTLGLTLFSIAEYKKHKVKITKKDLDWQIVFPTYYYGELKINDHSTLPYKTPDKFKQCYHLWRQFCLHQLFTQALEGIMNGVLEIVGSESSGLTLNDVVRGIIQGQFYQILKKVSGQKCNRPSDLLGIFKVKNIPTESESYKIQNEISFLNKFSEATILGLKTSSPSEIVAKYLFLMAVLYLKWRGIRSEIGFKYVATRVGNEMWEGSIFQELDTWVDKHTTWEDIISKIISLFILDQHDRIMYEKRRLDSCWLHRQEGKILKDQDYSPRFRSSRHWNVVSILRDLKLLKFSTDKEIYITKYGNNILKKII